MNLQADPRQCGLQTVILSIPGSHGHSTLHVPKWLEMSEAVSFPSGLTRSQKLLERVLLGYQALIAQEEVKLDAYCRINSWKWLNSPYHVKGRNVSGKKKEKSE